MIKLDTTYNGSCIYCILNQESGMYYFGQTRSFQKRSKEHLADLKGQRHRNIRLQRVFNLEKPLVIFPVEFCKEDVLNEREIFWINYHNSTERNTGYNLSGGGHPLKSLTQESINKRADARRGKPGSLKGRKQTEEHIRNKSLATKGISRPMSEKTLLALRKARQDKKGKTVSGIRVNITNINTGEVSTFDAVRRAAAFLNIDERSLTMKFYKGRAKIKVSSILFNNYKIEKNV